MLADKKISTLYAVPLQALPREVGIEVEMEGINLPREDIPHWTVGRDGSLRGENAEYALQRPCSRRLVSGRLTILYDILRNRGRPSERCGTHIHLNCQHLTSRQVFSFISLYFFFEGLLTKWCGKDREGNMFCLRSEDAEGLIISLISDKMNKGYPYAAAEEHLKYGAINISALRKFGSLEFRALRSQRDKGVVEKWVRMLLSIKDLAIKEKNVENCMMNFSANGATSLVKEVFGEEAPSLIGVCKNEEELDRIVSDGIRRTQALVYTPFRKE